MRNRRNEDTLHLLRFAKIGYVAHIGDDILKLTVISQKRRISDADAQS